MRHKSGLKIRAFLNGLADLTYELFGLIGLTDEIDEKGAQCNDL